jgi:uncharacterized protein (DUF433 family)
MPGRCGGDPCIKGTRITAALIYTLCERDGVPPERVASDEYYPFLSLEQVLAAVTYVAQHPEEFTKWINQYNKE